VVQFSRDRLSRLEYAAKFFISQAAFNDEAALYSDASSALGRFLPRFRNIIDNADGHMRDRNGRPFPPCIVMEKGESLDMWMQRKHAGVDMETGLQVWLYQCYRIRTAVINHAL
jgi:hypothetical protein